MVTMATLLEMDAVLADRPYHLSLKHYRRWTGREGYALEGDIGRVERLLRVDKYRAGVKDSGGYTALHYAARSGHSTIVRILLQAGADVNTTTPGGATALHRAASKGHHQLVLQLLEAGAKPAAQDSDGNTALHRAAAEARTAVDGENGWYRCIQLLVQADDGECWRMRNNKQQTPLDLCRCEVTRKQLSAMFKQ